MLLSQNAGIGKVVFEPLRVETQQAVPSLPPRRFQPRNLRQLDDALMQFEISLAKRNVVADMERLGQSLENRSQTIELFRRTSRR